MTFLDSPSNIVSRVEDNLKNDRFLLEYARENNGWIRLEFVNRCKNLSNYTYETILHALSIKSSNQFELSRFEPRCIRSRCQTVIVTGLPSTVLINDLFDFFNRFYPVEEINPVPSFSNRCQRIIHVKFQHSTDAIALVQQSQQQTIRYSTTHPINCQLLTEQKSSLTATEQILKCQNLNRDKPEKICELKNEKIIFNRFSYEFTIPHHLLKQTHSCLIISALNPSCFTIQLREHALNFDRFQREINAFYNTNNDQRYIVRREEIQNNLCVISSDENKIWNRSQILDYHPSDQTVNLFYVDLGTWEEYVPIHRLRHLTERFHQYFVCSITCRLASIRPISIDHENDLLSWTDDATKQFLAVIGDNPVDIEFVSLSLNNCFQTRLFVWNSNQYVCTNDYLVHIQQAKTIPQNQSSDETDEQNGIPIHPVIGLYNRLGEVLQQSRTASISSSNLSSPLFTSKSNVKLIHVVDSRHTNQQQDIPMIFIHHERAIFMPDFNLVYLLRLIYPYIDKHTIERYAFNVHYRSKYLTHESNFEAYTQLNSLRDNQDLQPIVLYTLDFVEQIFQHYKYRLINVETTIKNAKQVTDISHWFTTDNEFRNHSQQPSIPYRLPFSNRLITPI